MTDLEKIDEAVKDFYKAMHEEGLRSDEICVRIIASGRTSRIYKSIADFQEKALLHIEKIDPMFSVDFELYIFD